MKTLQSPLGLALALIYIVISVFLIATQGLFGESFIVLLLGLPWSLVFASFEYGNASGAVLYVFVLGPLALNAVILYWIGSRISGKKASQLG